LAGCGSEKTGDAAGGGDELDPTFLVNVPHQGQAIVRVGSDGDADRVCDAAKLDEYRELDGVRVLIVKAPSADQGRNSDGERCELPAQ
jgi:hypothetical protein